MSKNAGKEVEKVLNSGYVGQGPKVDEFEKDLRKKLISVNNMLIKRPEIELPAFSSI